MPGWARAPPCSVVKAASQGRGSTTIALVGHFAAPIRQFRCYLRKQELYIKPTALKKYCRDTVEVKKGDLIDGVALEVGKFISNYSRNYYGRVFNRGDFSKGGKDFGKGWGGWSQGKGAWKGTLGELYLGTLFSRSWRNPLIAARAPGFLGRI